MSKIIKEEYHVRHEMCLFSLDPPSITLCCITGVSRAEVHHVKDHRRRDTMSDMRCASSRIGLSMCWVHESSFNLAGVHSRKCEMLKLVREGSLQCLSTL